MLTCPSSGWRIDEAVPAGYLDGLTCQMTSASGAAQDVPLAQVVKVEEEEHDSISGGAVFGIIVAVVIAFSAVGYIAWFAPSQSAHARAEIC